MLTVDLNLPRRVVDSKTGEVREVHVVFRKSMEKFGGGTSKDLEIVKHSMPAQVYLNAPFIMILDQVSFHDISRDKLLVSLNSSYQPRVFIRTAG